MGISVLLLSMLYLLFDTSMSQHTNKYILTSNASHPERIIVTDIKIQLPEQIGFTLGRMPKYLMRLNVVES